MSVPFEGAAEAGGDSESACGASSSNSQIGQPSKTAETRAEAKCAVSGSVGPHALSWEEVVDGLQRMEAVLKGVGHVRAKRP